MNLVDALIAQPDFFNDPYPAYARLPRRSARHLE